MPEALVNPRVLKWARERAGLPVDKLAKRLNSSSSKIAAWEAGDSRPTFRQAEKLADATHVPFGFLFLPAPPEEKLPIPDLRVVDKAVSPALDADFIDTLRDIQFKHDWYREYLLEHGHQPLPFVGRFKKSTAPKQVADDMRRELGVGLSERLQARSWEEYFRILVARAERIGIWVIRNGVVGNNTHRPLSVEVFRGFAISDDVAPLVFVNGRDAKAAQIFTLAHELAHIWFGQSGISDPFQAVGASSAPSAQIEKLCNAVAAEFLLPETEFISSWRADVPLEQNADHLCAHFRVSRIVVAIRADGLGLVRKPEFQRFWEEEKRRWAEERTEGVAGGDYYRTAKARNGERFMRAVLASAMSGDILLRTAGALLNMTPKSVQEAYRRQQEGIL